MLGMRVRPTPDGRSGCRQSAVAWVLALVLVGGGRSATGQSASTIFLGETVPKGSASRVRIEMRASGLFRQGLPPGQLVDEARMPKPATLDIQTRMTYDERVLTLIEDSLATAAGVDKKVGAVTRGRPARVVRRVVQAASAINGEKGQIRPMTAVLRPEVSLLVAERRRDDGPVVVVSPAGPLTGAELQVVQAACDPLALTDILPAGPVERGRSWRVAESAARGISEYDTITACTLEATLESFDEARATVRLQGRIEGSLQGAPGLMTCDGLLALDRRKGWIDRLDLKRNESRRPGPVEAGLDVKSTITLVRTAEPPPATLLDSALIGYSLEVTPERARLLQESPDGKASLVHDRKWHLFWDNQRLVVLKRLEGQRVVAQCNLVVGPPAGRGRHQDATQFRDEVRKVLGRRFVRFLGAGEVEGDPAGGYRYKVGVLGTEGDLQVVWYYYLIASPEGDQLVVTYTLAAQDAQGLGDQDAEMIASLRWSQPRQAASRR